MARQLIYYDELPKKVQEYINRHPHPFHGHEYVETWKATDGSNDPEVQNEVGCAGNHYYYTQSKGTTIIMNCCLFIVLDCWHCYVKYF